MVEIANDFSLEHIGIHIMVAGLALQAVSLALFIVLSVHFAWRCSRRPYDWDTQHKGVRRTRRFRIFLCGQLFPGHKISETDQYSCRPGHADDPHPIVLPCRGAFARFSWQALERPSDFYGPGEYHGGYCLHLSHGHPSRSGFQGELASSELQDEEGERTYSNRSMNGRVYRRLLVLTRCDRSVLGAGTMIN